MLRGYRLYIAALGLVLTSPSYGQERQADKDNPERNTPSQLGRIAAAIEKQPIASAPDGGCQPGQDDRQSDLCAQWKAADAAAESARWNFWTFIASIIGIIVGGGTLFAAWRAAHWAKEAAKHTETSALEGKRAADAAEKSVAETQRIGEAQVRCYPSIAKANYVIVDDKAMLNLWVRNSGSSPASQLHCVARFCILRSELNTIRYVEHVPERFVWHYIVASDAELQVRPVIGPYGLDEAEWGDLGSGKSLYLEAEVTINFVDVFGTSSSLTEYFTSVVTSKFQRGVKLELTRSGKGREATQRTANNDSRSREGY